MKKILSRVLTLLISGLLCGCVVPPTSTSSQSTSSSNSSSSSSSSSSTTQITYKYNDFTENEKAELDAFFGFEIPFIPNDEYYLEEFSYIYEGVKSYGYNFLAFDNTLQEFNNYLEAISSAGFISDGTSIDNLGDTWYLYSKGDAYLDVLYYLLDNRYVVELYVYYTEEGVVVDPPVEHTYTDFTVEEKTLFNDTFSFVLPFIPNDEYYVEEYYYDMITKEETGLCFYTFGNKEEEFYDFLYALMKLNFVGVDTYEDDYRDKWYIFENGDIEIATSYYKSRNETGEKTYVIDVYVYRVNDKEFDIDEVDPNHNKLITNKDAGLPLSNNGVYNVNFNDAKYVKDVRDQGAFKGGCPTEGDVRVLVIPVEFSDITAASKGYDIDKLETAFNGKNEDTTYFSVANYYKESSYGKLNLTFDICDDWYRSKNESSYYEDCYIDIFGVETWVGDQVIMDEALEYLSKTMDLSIYDSDNNSKIDAVILVSTNEIDDSDYFTWATRYWNYIKDEDGNPFKYDDVSANDYIWCPYQFIHEKEEGVYDAYDSINPLTFIHEFGHVLGSTDLYNQNGRDAALENHDIMDSMVGDHNPYTKINYGWIKNSRLVVADSTVTLNLNSFTETGDTIIIANNFDPELGAYQEYYVLMYYKNDGVNFGDTEGYFEEEGILMYHINSSLFYDEIYGYDVHNNNNNIYGGNYRGTIDNLVEFVKYAGYQIVYTQGCTSSSEIVDDLGNVIPYTFTVDALNEEYATITFNKNN